MFNPYRTFYMAHDWEIATWKDSYRVETPITLGAMAGGYAGYKTGSSGWQDAHGGIYQPLAYCRYTVNIWLHLVEGELVWRGTFVAFQNRSGSGTISASIQKSDAGYLDPLGVWEVLSSTTSGAGITMGTSIEVTE